MAVNSSRLLYYHSLSVCAWPLSGAQPAYHTFPESWTEGRSQDAVQRMATYIHHAQAKTVKLFEIHVCYGK